MSIEKYFSVPVFLDDLSPSTIDNSLSIAQKYMKEHNWHQQINKGVTLTTYYKDSRVDYLGQVQDEGLLVEVERCSRKFLDELGVIDSADLVIESWLNLNTKYTGHNNHEHFGSFLGGVVYLDSNNDCGDLVLWDPVKLRSQTYSFYNRAFTKFSKYNHQFIRVTPKKNRIVLFESWLTHNVDSNLTDKDRISVAFNIYPSTNK